jgi:hypothetical protein
MSLFNWFSKKESPKPTVGIAQKPVRFASGLGISIDGSAAPALSAEPSNHRRAERVERREQLYGVVRDAMTRAGVLSASYKFKVLSLDSRGGSYLIMTDLSSQASIDAQRMAEIESLIAQNAKGRHEILVAAVYWRLSDHVTAGLSAKFPSQSAVSSASTQPAPANRPADAVDLTEMLAFKSAFAAVAVAAPLSASGEILKSKRRNPNPQPQFENTEILDADERAPLGATQYGALN